MADEVDTTVAGTSGTEGGESTDTSTPPAFKTDAEQEAWLADQREKQWDEHERERKENVQKGRDDWSRSNKEHEDRIRSKGRNEGADRIREQRESQESRWAQENEAEEPSIRLDRERYVDRPSQGGLSGGPSGTPPAFKTDAKRETWLADQREELWEQYERERKENVQKGRDNWRRQNKEREDRFRSRGRNEDADRIREQRENQESRWSRDYAEEEPSIRLDQERYVDRPSQGGLSGGPSGYRDSPYFEDTPHHRRLIDPSDPLYQSPDSQAYREALDLARELSGRRGSYQDSPYYVDTLYNRRLIDPTDPAYHSDEAREYRDSLDQAWKTDARNVMVRWEFDSDARASDTAWQRAKYGSPFQPTQAQLNAATGPDGTPLFGHQTPEEARRLSRMKSPNETWEEYRERQAAVEGLFRENDETRARLERRGELQFEGESDEDFEDRRAAFLKTEAEAIQRARETGQPVKYQGPQSQLSWELERLNAQGLGSAEFGEALDELAGLVRFEGTARGEDREWLAGQTTFFGEVGEAVAEGRAGTPEALEKAIEMLGEVYHSPDVTPEQRAYLDGVIEAHSEAKGRAIERVTGQSETGAVADLQQAGAYWMGTINALGTPEQKAQLLRIRSSNLSQPEALDALAELTGEVLASVANRANYEAADKDNEGKLLAHGLTPEEIDYTRERQGGTITKFEQADADAVNAMRGVWNAEELDQHFEAALLEQGATPEEIAYVRERQGGTLTKFEQDDADAVNARRQADDAAAASDDEANRLELVAANELYAESMGEFGSRDGTFDLGAQAVDEQFEAALLAQGATPDEIAYVRDRQGGTITKFEQDDADALNAMRLDQAVYDFHTRNELSAQESEEVRAGYFRAIDDYQQQADLWEAEQEMGAAEVNPRLALARGIRASLDSGEQGDLQHGFEAGFVPHGPVPPIVTGEVGGDSDDPLSIGIPIIVTSTDLMRALRDAGLSDAERKEVYVRTMRGEASPLGVDLYAALDLPDDAAVLMKNTGFTVSPTTAAELDARLQNAGVTVSSGAADSRTFPPGYDYDPSQLQGEPRSVAGIIEHYKRSGYLTAETAHFHGPVESHFLPQLNTVADVQFELFSLGLTEAEAQAAVKRLLDDGTITDDGRRVSRDAALFGPTGILGPRPNPERFESGEAWERADMQWQSTLMKALTYGLTPGQIGSMAPKHIRASIQSGTQPLQSMLAEGMDEAAKKDGEGLWSFLWGLQGAEWTVTPAAHGMAGAVIAREYGTVPWRYAEAREAGGPGGSGITGAEALDLALTAVDFIPLPLAKGAGLLSKGGRLAGKLADDYVPAYIDNYALGGKMEEVWQWIHQVDASYDANPARFKSPAIILKQAELRGELTKPSATQDKAKIRRLIENLEYDLSHDPQLSGVPDLSPSFYPPIGEVYNKPFTPIITGGQRPLSEVITGGQRPGVQKPIVFKPLSGGAAGSSLPLLDSSGSGTPTPKTPESGGGSGGEPSNPGGEGDPPRCGLGSNHELPHSGPRRPWQDDFAIQAAFGLGHSVRRARAFGNGGRRCAGSCGCASSVDASTRPGR